MQTFFYDILHAVSQLLLVPDIILLLALIGYSLFSIGSILVERFTEHVHYQVAMPQFLAALTEAREDMVPSVIEESGLLNRQKEALKTVHEYRGLPGDALIALVKRLMSEEEAHYDAIVNRNNMAAKVAPMLGLMGTLIPLGPGIQALGQADTAALSSSLLVAFDTTVAGLVTAAVCLVIGKIRSTWYNNYLSALDSAMATMIQKIEDSRNGAAPQFAAPRSVAEQDYGEEPAPDIQYEIDQQMNADAAAQPALQQPALQQPAMQQPAVQQPLEPAAPYDAAQEGDYDLAYVGQASEPATTPSGMPIEPSTMPSGMPLNPSDAEQPLSSLFGTARDGENY